MHTTQLLVSSLILLLVSLSFGQQVVELQQSDFDQGTYIISQPGLYKLQENILFNPNNVAQLGVSSYYAGDVLPTQYTTAGGKYDSFSYSLGFFAAIAISTSDVTLDLNGFSIKQSKEHALQQRFYCHIELADQPFKHKQGPHEFGETLVPGQNIIIKNGKLARSSHHGIHGNDNRNITLENLDITDFEVAGIALNGVSGLTIRDVRIHDSRRDSPVLALFSHARFIRPYVEWLVGIDSKVTLQVQGTAMSISDIKSDLERVINNVFEDVITDDKGYIEKSQHPEEYALFANLAQVVDGNCYGILLNRPGVAVDGFPFVPVDPASGVTIDNVQIENIAGNIKELIALQTTTPPGATLTDPIGAPFSVFNLHPDTQQPITVSSYDFQARYLGNPIANAQAFVGKAMLLGEFEGSSLQIPSVKFNDEIFAWIESFPGNPLSDYTDKYPMYCTGDCMFHVNKGVIGMKLDAAFGVRVRNSKVENIFNYGNIGISGFCNYDKDSISHPKATLPGYTGADARGFSFSGSVNITVSNTDVRGVSSYSGSAYGFDVFTDSYDITMENCNAYDINAGVLHSLDDYDNNPTPYPEAYGFKCGINATDVLFHNVECKNVHSVGQHGDVLILGDGDLEVDSSPLTSTSGASCSVVASLFVVILSLVLL